MFICKKCGKDRPKAKKRAVCIDCNSAYLRQWKANRPEKQTAYNQKSNSSSRVKKIKRKNVENRQKRRRHIKKLCVEYLGGVCQYEGGCSSPIREGLEECYASFQFHHVDPSTKTAGLAAIINTKMTDAMIRQMQIVSDLKKCSMLVEELAKCVLLCANCHNRVEYCDGCKRDSLI